MHLRYTLANTLLAVLALYGCEAAENVEMNSVGIRPVKSELIKLKFSLEGICKTRSSDSAERADRNAWVSYPIFRFKYENVGKRVVMLLKPEGRTYIVCRSASTGKPIEMLYEQDKGFGPPGPDDWIPLKPGETWEYTTRLICGAFLSSNIPILAVNGGAGIPIGTYFLQACLTYIETYTKWGKPIERHIYSNVIEMKVNSEDLRY
jgi:hypothetical protein